MRTSHMFPHAAGTVNQPVRIPDFFIIGAPKAGTTSLYTYLAAHPQIFMPQIKEPFFFSSDLERENETKIKNLNKYLNLFDGATDQCLASGEASPVYLLSKVAVPNILAFNPGARFIVMLRNPVELVLSFHSQLVRDFWESVTDFEQAWRLQEERAQGRCIPRSCLERTYLQYRHVGRLGEQVRRLLAHISSDRIKILMFEDLATSSKSVYEDVLVFLGVPSDHRLSFSTENPNQTQRSRRLAQLIHNPPFPLNVLKHQYRRHVGLGTWPARVLKRLNSKRVSRAPLPPKLRRELEAEFHDDVRLLECLIDRDLSHWICRRSRISQFASQAS